MKFRKLRIAWSFGCSLATTLLVVLWVRSYWKADYIQPWRQHSVVSLRGTLFVDKGIVQTTSAIGDLPAALQSKQYSFVPFSSGLAIRYWTVTALTEALAIVPWLRFRFTLRTLLIATTLFAIALGLIMAVV